jgi:hypothetical protein
MGEPLPRENTCTPEAELIASEDPLAERRERRRQQIKDDVAVDVREAIEQLPPKQREVVELKLRAWLDERDGAPSHTWKTIAAVIGANHNTARRNYAKGRQNAARWFSTDQDITKLFPRELFQQEADEHAINLDRLADERWLRGGVSGSAATDETGSWEDWTEAHGYVLAVSEDVRVRKIGNEERVKGELSFTDDSSAAEPVEPDDGLGYGLREDREARKAAEHVSKRRSRRPTGNPAFRDVLEYWLPLHDRFRSLTKAQDALAEAARADFERRYNLTFPSRDVSETEFQGAHRRYRERHKDFLPEPLFDAQLSAIRKAHPPKSYERHRDDEPDKRRRFVLAPPTKEEMPFRFVASHTFKPAIVGAADTDEDSET